MFFGKPPTEPMLLSQTQKLAFLLVGGLALTVVFGVVWGLALRDNVAYFPQRRAPALRFEEAVDPVVYWQLVWFYGLLTTAAFLLAVVAAFRLRRL
jgi:hypothetical protein